MIRFAVAFLIACGVATIFTKRMPLLTLLGLELCLNGVLLALLSSYTGFSQVENLTDASTYVIAVLCLFALAVVETVIIATLQLRLEK